MLPTWKSKATVRDFVWLEFGVIMGIEKRVKSILLCKSGIKCLYIYFLFVSGTLKMESMGTENVL